MGQIISYTYYDGNRPDHIPASRSEPTFPPDFGFKEPRKVRVSQMSEQEMKALQIAKGSRDYCAHILKDIFMCRKHYAPFYFLCKPEYERYSHCQYEDIVHNMKEFEREKRLRIRELKLQGKTVS